MIVPAAEPPVDGVTDKLDAVVLIQVPFATTVMFPVVVLEGVTEMVFVVDVPVQPLGTVQVYDVAPVTAATL